MALGIIINKKCKMKRTSRLVGNGYEPALCGSFTVAVATCRAAWARAGPELCSTPPLTLATPLALRARRRQRRSRRNRPMMLVLHRYPRPLLVLLALAIPPYRIFGTRDHRLLLGLLPTPVQGISRGIILSPSIARCLNRML